MKETTYAGRLSNSGAQEIKAPLAQKIKKGPAKVKRGEDLRSKK